MFILFAPRSFRSNERTWPAWDYCCRPWKSSKITENCRNKVSGLKMLNEKLVSQVKSVCLHLGRYAGSYVFFLFLFLTPWGWITTVSKLKEPLRSPLWPWMSIAHPLRSCDGRIGTLLLAGSDFLGFSARILAAGTLPSSSFLFSFSTFVLLFFSDLRYLQDLCHRTCNIYGDVSWCFVRSVLLCCIIPPLDSPLSGLLGTLTQLTYRFVFDPTVTMWCTMRRRCALRTIYLCANVDVTVQFVQLLWVCKVLVTPKLLFTYLFFPLHLSVKMLHFLPPVRPSYFASSSLNFCSLVLAVASGEMGGLWDTTMRLLIAQRLPYAMR